MNLYTYAFAAVATVFALWIFYRSEATGMPVSTLALLGVIYPIGLFMHLSGLSSFWPYALESFGLVPLVAVTWLVLWPIQSQKVIDAIRLATAAAVGSAFVKLVLVEPVLLESLLVLLSYLLTVLVLKGYHNRIKHAEDSIKRHRV